MAARLGEATDGAPPAGGARAFGAYLSSLVHDVSMLQGMLEHLGEPWCEHADDGAWWDEGRAVSLSATLPAGGRAHLVHHHLPGVSDYRERVTVHCSDRVLELTFPSPYLRHEPTRLVEYRSEGATRTAHDGAPRLLRGGVPRAVARVRGRLRGPGAGRHSGRGRACGRRASARRLPARRRTRSIDGSVAAKPLHFGTLSAHFGGVGGW